MGEAPWLELVADESILAPTCIRIGLDFALAKLALQINHAIQLVANIPKTGANPAGIVLATLID